MVYTVYNVYYFAYDTSSQCSCTAIADNVDCEVEVMLPNTYLGRTAKIIIIVYNYRNEVSSYQDQLYMATITRETDRLQISGYTNIT